MDAGRELDDHTPVGRAEDQETTWLEWFAVEAVSRVGVDAMSFGFQTG